MTEREWLACETAEPMLVYLGASPGGGKALKREQRPRPDRRKLRLFACACVRPFFHLLSTPSREAIEVAEQFADGIATEEDRARAEDSAWKVPDLRGDGSSPGCWLAAAAHNAVGPSAREAGYYAPSNITSAINTATAPEEWGGEIPAWVPVGGDAPVHRGQAYLLRDVFGNPFRPIVVRESWRTPIVLALARAAYETRSLPSGELDVARLHVLTDALEEAGCDNADVLRHLRGPGPHVRGCWAVDLVGVKE
jgi:hypothetical protein